MIWDCNHGKAKCWYHDVNAWTGLGKRREVGNPICNSSGSQTVDRTLTWRTDRTTTYSFEQSTSVEVSAGLENEITTGMSTSSTQTETWTAGSTLSASQSLTSHIRPGEAGGWWFAAVLEALPGLDRGPLPQVQPRSLLLVLPGPGFHGRQDHHAGEAVDGQMKGKWYWASWKC